MNKTIVYDRTCLACAIASDVIVPLLIQGSATASFAMRFLLSLLVTLCVLSAAYACETLTLQILNQIGSPGGVAFSTASASTTHMTPDGASGAWYGATLLATPTPTPTSATITIELFGLDVFCSDLYLQVYDINANVVAQAPIGIGLNQHVLIQTTIPITYHSGSAVFFVDFNKVVDQQTCQITKEAQAPVSYFITKIC
jgi:hypothetical protein